MRVLCNADDLEPAGMFDVIAEVLPQRAPVFEILLRKELVHHGDVSRRGCVLLVVRAALQNLGADGVEISGTYAHPRSTVVLGSRRRWWFAFDEDSFAPVISLHRTVEGEADLLYARDSGQTGVELAIERLQLTRLVSGHLRVEVQDVSIRGVEAEVL